ncbi:MAG: hypothetical protein ABI382_08130 [Nakamurella sp.]
MAYRRKPPHQCRNRFRDLPHNRIKAAYDGWLDPTLDSTLATGNSATGNFGRSEDPAATKTPVDYTKTGTEEEPKTAIGTLSKVMSEHVAVTPILYAAGWYEYNTKSGSDRVNKNNHFIDPSPDPTNVEFVILHLTANS